MSTTSRNAWLVLLFGGLGFEPRVRIKNKWDSISETYPPIQGNLSPIRQCAVRAKEAMFKTVKCGHFYIYIYIYISGRLEKNSVFSWLVDSTCIFIGQGWPRGMCPGLRGSNSAPGENQSYQPLPARDSFSNPMVDGLGPPVARLESGYLFL